MTASSRRPASRRPPTTSNATTWCGTVEVEAARRLVGAAVGDVQRRAVGARAMPLGLSKPSATTSATPAPGPSGRRSRRPRGRAEALQVAVGRVGEPDRPVGGDDDVVGGVQPPAPPVVDDDACVPRSPGRRARCTRRASGRPARRRRAGRRGRASCRWPSRRRSPAPSRRPARPGSDRRRARCGGSRCAGRRRERGDVQRVLVGDVDGALVGVALDDQLEPRRRVRSRRRRTGRGRRTGASMAASVPRRPRPVTAPPAM